MDSVRSTSQLKHRQVFLNYLNKPVDHSALPHMRADSDNKTQYALGPPAHDVRASPSIYHDQKLTCFKALPYSQASKSQTRCSTREQIDLQQFYQPSNNEMNLKFQVKQTIPPALFCYSDLTSLDLSHCGLARLPPEIGNLRKLRRLDLSQNYLETLPMELGLLVDLRTLNLFGNKIKCLPSALSSLGRLDKLFLDRNPIVPKQKEAYAKGGIPALMRHLRSNAPKLEPPKPRQLLDLVEPAISNVNNKFRVLSYNLLSPQSAVPARYSSVSSDVLAWESRQKAILGEIAEEKCDVLCFQEVDPHHYHNYWRPQLEALGYIGIFHSKIRYGNGDADGCATFWSHTRFTLHEDHLINLAEAAIQCSLLHDENGNVFTRANKDNIAIVTILQDHLTATPMIVANTHLVANHSYKDVKVVQAAVLFEKLGNIATDCAERLVPRYADNDGTLRDASLQAKTRLLASRQHTSSPSFYDIPLILAGDFNSLPNSAVYQLLSTGYLEPNHEDFDGFSYGHLTQFGCQFPHFLTSSYEATGEDCNFTIYTPHLKGTVDYIWYNRAAIQATRVLGPADDAYTKKVLGFPSEHFPSDHIKLVAEFGYWGDERGSSNAPIKKGDSMF